MSIYQVRNLTKHYKVLEHDHYARALALGDDELMDRLLNEPVDSVGLKDVWVEEEAEFTSHHSTATEIPDISVWGTFLILNQKTF